MLHSSEDGKLPFKPWRKHSQVEVWKFQFSLLFSNWVQLEIDIVSIRGASVIAGSGDNGCLGTQVASYWSNCLADNTLVTFNLKFTKFFNLIPTWKFPRFPVLSHWKMYLQLEFVSTNSRHVQFLEMHLSDGIHGPHGNSCLLFYR